MKLPNNTLSKLIRGVTSDPRNETMKKLARLFMVDQNWLSQGIGAPPVPTGVIPLKPTDTPSVYLAGNLEGWEKFERRAKVNYAFLVPEEAYLAGREFALDRWILHVDEKVVAAIAAYAWFSMPPEQQREVATRYHRAQSDLADAESSEGESSEQTQRASSSMPVSSPR